MSGVADCTCTPFPYGDGPEIDCPVHGADCTCGRKVGAHSQDRATRVSPDPGPFQFICEGGPGD